ncbi:MAG: TraB/VirB10 family protein [Nitrospirae bacterium]|nr:TraB/VirB10 family protein [Nitrospirota bacterium]
MEEGERGKTGGDAGSMPGSYDSSPHRLRREAEGAPVGSGAEDGTEISGSCAVGESNPGPASVAAQDPHNYSHRRPRSNAEWTERMDLTLKTHGLSRRQAVVGAGLVLAALMAIITAGRATGEAPPLDVLKEGVVGGAEAQPTGKAVQAAVNLPPVLGGAEGIEGETPAKPEEDPVARWRAMGAEAEAAGGEQRAVVRAGSGFDSAQNADALINREKMKDMERRLEESEESRHQLELSLMKEIAELKNKAEGGRSITTISGSGGASGSEGHAGHEGMAEARPVGRGKIIVNPSAGAASDESGVYFPSGSFAAGVLLTGALAPDTDQQLPYPLLVRLQGSFVGPNRFKIPAHGCFALGRASGRAVARRAEIQVFQMSCVYEDGTSMDRKINGWVSGEDGILGVPGIVENHDGLYIAGTIAARTAQAFSQAIAASQLTTQLTPLGGAQQKVDGSLVSYGFSSAGAGFFDSLAKIMEERIRRNVPVIRVEPGKEIHVVLAQGFEGMPPDLALPVH